MLEIGLPLNNIWMSVARGKLNAPAGIEVIKLELKPICTVFCNLSNVPTGIDVILLALKSNEVYSVNFATSAGTLVRALFIPTISIDLVFKTCSNKLILESPKAFEEHRILKPLLPALQMHGEIAVAAGQISAEVDATKTTYDVNSSKIKATAKSLLPG